MTMLFNPNNEFNVHVSTSMLIRAATTTARKQRKQKMKRYRFALDNLLGVLIVLWCTMNFFRLAPLEYDHHRYQMHSYYSNNITDPTWTQYYYNKTRMQRIRRQWTNRHAKAQSQQQQNIDSVLVIIIQQQQPSVSFHYTASSKQQEQERQQQQLLMNTIHDAVRYTQLAHILVYLSDYDAELVSTITKTFHNYIEMGQLILLLCERPILEWNDQQYSSMTAYNDLRDGLTYAYLLDLAYQYGFNYTLLLPVGWQLNTADTVAAVDHPTDYVEQAIQHYMLIEESRRNKNDWNRTCWTVLSDHQNKNHSSSSYGVLFFDTVEHASRMSIFLQSSLPYNYKNYMELLDIYCDRFIWSGSVVFGPPVFTKNINNNNNEEPQDNDTAEILSSTSVVSKSFVVDENIHPPSWIDPTMTHVGPRVVDDDDDIDKTQYLLTFGVTTMLRPVVNTTYLLRFMNDLINIVERHFVVPVSVGHDDITSQYSAVIVVLIAGNTLDDIHTLRKFLEDTYAVEVKRNMIQLVDSPLESYSKKLSSMRQTYRFEDSELRRYWRSKQNLDVGALFRATLGFSKYVMLLEDDTGFQPEFANLLKARLDEDSKLDYSTTFPWAQTMYGLGYSGVLLHAMDVPVYATLHTTFFDEHPCDILDIWMLIRDGKRDYVYSPPDLQYLYGLYLKHLGAQSSLIDKELWSTIWFDSEVDQL